MKKLNTAIIVFATGAALSATAGAQQVTLNFDNLNPCSGTPLSTYQSWIALTAGVTCQSSPTTWNAASSSPNYLSAGLAMGWTFLNGPVSFGGMSASGFGTYYLELLLGGTSVYTGSFLLQGSPIPVNPGYAGSVDEVRFWVYEGYGTLSVDDVRFTPPQPQVIIDPSTPPPGDTPTLDGGGTNVAPEPTSLLLLASGLGGLGAAFRRRRAMAA